MILGVIGLWAGLVCLKIEIWFPRNNSRMTRHIMMKFYMLTDLIERKIPIDFRRDRIVGGACVSKNRNMVSTI